MTPFPAPLGTVSMGCTIERTDTPLPRYRCGVCGLEWAEDHDGVLTNDD